MERCRVELAALCEVHITLAGMSESTVNGEAHDRRVTTEASPIVLAAHPPRWTSYRAPASAGWNVSGVLAGGIAHQIHDTLVLAKVARVFPALTTAS